MDIDLGNGVFRLQANKLKPVRLYCIFRVAKVNPSDGWLYYKIALLNME